MNCTRLIDYIIFVGNHKNLPLSSHALRKTIPELIKFYPPTHHDDFPLSSDVALFCQPEGCLHISKEWLHATESQTTFLFTLTDKDTNKTRYGVCYNFYRPINSSFHLNESNFQKCTKLTNKTKPSPSPFSHILNSICIISHYPFVTQFGVCLRVLKNMYDSVQNRFGKLSSVWNIICGSESLPSASSVEYAMLQSIEKWIFRLLSVPAPIPGQTCIMVKVNNEESQGSLDFALPDRTRLSLIDFPLHLSLELLGVETCLKVLSCILLEKKVVFQSSSAYTLTSCVMSFIVLLYPLQYMFPVIPLLPTCMSSSEQLLLAPTPFVIGVLSSFFPTKANYFLLPSDVWIVDLDSSSITCSNETDAIPQYPKEAYDELVFHFQQVLDLIDAQKPILDLEAFMKREKVPTPKRALFSNTSNSSPGSKIIIGNDPDSVDIALRVSMVRFFNSSQVLKDFATYTRTLRLYPRAVVAFQTQHFLLSRKEPSSFTKLLVDTQAVEYLAEWSLLPDNDAYEKISHGIFDPLVIGDKAKWFASYLKLQRYSIFEENVPFGPISSIKTEMWKRCANCSNFFQEMLLICELSPHQNISSPNMTPLLADIKEHYQPLKQVFIAYESSQQPIRVSPFVRESLRTSIVKGPRDSIRNRIASVSSDRSESFESKDKKDSSIKKESSDWLQSIAASLNYNTIAPTNSDPRQFLLDVVGDVIKGKTIGMFVRNKFRPIMKNEVYRNYLLHQLNGTIILTENNDYSSFIMDDVVLPSKNVYQSLCWILEVVIQGLEYSLLNGDVGGTASTFMLLEILHSHFMYQSPAAQRAFNKADKISNSSKNNSVDSKEDDGLMAAVGSPVTMNGEEYEAIDLIKLSSSQIDGKIDRRLSHSAYLVNAKGKDNGVVAPPLLLLDSRALSNSDPILFVEEALQLSRQVSHSNNNNNNNNNTADMQSSWKRLRIPLECAKSCLNQGYRYASERLLSVRPTSPHEMRSYLFEHFLSTSQSNNKRPLWDDMQFWEDLFLDIVARERALLGLQQHPNASMDLPVCKLHNELHDEKRRLELEEDRVLATILFNMISYMIMMNVSLSIVKSKGRRLVAKSHIGLHYSQKIHRLLENLPRLKGNDADLLMMPSRQMFLRSYPVYFKSAKSDEMYFLQVTEDCLILRNKLAVIKVRWWIDNIIYFSLNSKKNILTLWWSRQGDFIENDKLRSEFGQELNNQLEESIKNRPETANHDCNASIDKKVFRVRYPDRNNFSGRIDIQPDTVILHCNEQQFNIPMADIQRCKVINVNLVIVARHGTNESKSICHRITSDEATTIWSQLTQTIKEYKNKNNLPC